MQNQQTLELMIKYDREENYTIAGGQIDPIYVEHYSYYLEHIKYQGFVGAAMEVQYFEELDNDIAMETYLPRAEEYGRELYGVSSHLIKKEVFLLCEDEGKRLGLEDECLDRFTDEAMESYYYNRG